MQSAISKISQLDELRQDLLRSCQNLIFEVHHNAPPFWNDLLDSKLEAYLSQKPTMTFSTCPVCGHKLEGPEAPSEFHDPWWIYPQRAFSQAKVCSHFEALSFSILWSHSEPIGAPWIIPCGWGVPAFTEDLANSENFKTSIKSMTLPNGAIIFWIGFYRHFPGVPLTADYWSLPILKARDFISPSLHSHGFWNEYAPLSSHAPVVWSNLYLEHENGSLINFESKRDTSLWMQMIRAWSQLAYLQPMKMYDERFISESGLASFAIGMRSARVRGALFISQVPVFSITTASPLNPNSRAGQPNIQPITIEQMRDISQTDSLWAIIDPFQNEAAQDWLRLIRKKQGIEIRSLWSNSDLLPSWELTADSSYTSSLEQTNLVDFYRDLSPILVKITSDILDLSYHYPLGSQSWGVFFMSSQPLETIHLFLRQKLVCHFQNQWVYFRFYEPNFLSVALASLHNSDLNFFYGPIVGWVIRHPSENHYSLYTNANQRLSSSEVSDILDRELPPNIHEAAQRVFHYDLPRRMKEFLRDRTPEFANLLPSTVIDRWVRESIRQASQFGIRKEPNLTKFFLWKVLITPAWCYLPPFVRLLKQPVAEEVKIQNIENLFPQLRLTEIPRGIAIEAWDPDLWNQLRKYQSPLGHTDPEAFHPLLGERPPAMPMHNTNWLRTVGLFYETAYADLYAQAGIQLLDSVFSTEIQRPLHPPPRVLSLSPQEITIRDEGNRSHFWLKQHGFEKLPAIQGNWIYRGPTREATLLVARQFLEEFPYLENKFMFDPLSLLEKKALTENLELFSIYWDSHQFWILHRL